MPITNATYTSPDWTGFKYPFSLAPIPDWMAVGLKALCGFSMISALSCGALLSYLTYLFIVGGAGNRVSVRKNQYVILIYNLLLADLQLAIGFLISLKFLHDDQMYAPSSACIAQAWLTNVGDLGSGLFVLAIAAHTFLAVIFGRKLEFNTFCYVVIGLWVMSVIVTAIPVMLHPTDIFVASGNWCTINPTYDVLRLYCHYVWVFLAEFLVFVLYGITFVVFRYRMGRIMGNFYTSKSHSTGNSNGTSNFSNTMANSRTSRTERKLSLAALYMILYPIFYVIVTLPLAAGRIAGLAGNKPSPIYLLVGASFMTSAGWIDCLLYSLTRRALLTKPSSTVNEVRNGGQRPVSMSYTGKRDGNIELESHIKVPTSCYREIPSPAGSTDFIVHDAEAMEITPTYGGVRTETTWVVMTEKLDERKGNGKPQYETDVSALAV